MRAVLVDDEYYALQNLKLKLMEIGDVEVVGLYSDVDVFLKEICETKPDVVFLDVDMPKMDGFAVLDCILESGQTIQVVFVTAYSQYAAKAFDIDAADYIVKPVSVDRLRRSLSRLSKWIAADPAPIPSLSQTSADPLAEKLKITCFRSFSIKQGDTELNSGWKTKKAEELLAYLISEKGRFVSKNKIADTLWPELDGDKSLSNLHVTHYYLRLQEKNKGIKFPIESERGRMRIQIDKADCDLMQYDRLWECAKDPEMQLPEKAERFEQAIKLHTGLLFENQLYDWSVPLQQQCVNRYEEMLQFLILFHRETGNPKKARGFELLLDHL